MPEVVPASCVSLFQSSKGWAFSKGVKLFPAEMSGSDEALGRAMTRAVERFLGEDEDGTSTESDP